MKMKKFAPNIKSENHKPNQDWIYGIHAVKYALLNPKRQIQKLFLTTEVFEDLSQDNIDIRS